MMKLSDKIKPLLVEMRACSEAIKWCGDKTIEEALDLIRSII
jgi:hypothetical protein